MKYQQQLCVKFPKNTHMKLQIRFTESIFTNSNNICHEPFWEIVLSSKKLRGNDLMIIILSY